MTNTRRNNIVLASLLVAIVVLTSYFLRSTKSKTHEVSKKNKLISAQINAIENQITNIDSLRNAYQTQKELLAQQSKLIVEEDNSTLTFDYLLKILKWANLNLIFDFSASSEAKKPDYNEYVISGRAPFREVLTFVNQLEHQRSLITIEELSIGADNVAGSDTVYYSMVARTHYKEGGSNPREILKKDITYTPVTFPVFKSRISDSAIPRDSESNLMHLDKVTLIGMTESSAFIRDEMGVIRILTPGERVAYGYLYNLIPKEGKAVFKIDLYGITEEKILLVRPQKP